MTQDEIMTGNLNDELLEIREELDAAKEDTTPFPVVKDSEVTVIGDANKIQVKKNDYKLRFRFPKDRLAELGLSKISKSDIIMDQGTRIIVDVEYKDIHISPQRHVEAVSNVAKILPYYRKINDDGTITEYTAEEQIRVLAALNREVIGAMYDFVAWLLEVKESWAEYIMFDSLTNAMKEIIQNNPDLINATDFFSSSSARKA